MIFLLQIIVVSFYHISLKFFMITDVLMVYVFSFSFFFQFLIFFRKSDVTNIGPNFKFYIIIDLMAAAERTSSNKFKT